MTENGEPAGGLVGFLKSLGPLCNQFRPSKVVVVWESGGNQKRADISDGTYKGGRKPQSLNRFYGEDIPDTRENHNNQLTLTIDALKTLPIVQIYIKNTEADDIIGYICNYSFAGSPVIVVSSDRDFYQLINDRVSLWSLNQKRLIDKSRVKESTGFFPENITTARCFSGDPSDEIKGVKGVGFKSLLKRFPELGNEQHISVGEIVDSARALSENSGLSLYKEIVKSEEQVRKNWKLMHLDVSRLNGEQVKKLQHQLGTLPPQPNKIKLLRLLHKEGLRNVNIDMTFTSVRAILND
jgi:5'-3' exonuclease